MMLPNFPASHLPSFPLPASWPSSLFNMSPNISPRFSGSPFPRICTFHLPTSASPIPNSSASHPFAMSHELSAINWRGCALTLAPAVFSQLLNFTPSQLQSLSLCPMRIMNYQPARQCFFNSQHPTCNINFYNIQHPTHNPRQRSRLQSTQ